MAKICTKQRIHFVKKDVHASHLIHSSPQSSILDQSSTSIRISISIFVVFAFFHYYCTSNYVFDLNFLKEKISNLHSDFISLQKSFKISENIFSLTIFQVLIASGCIFANTKANFSLSKRNFNVQLFWTNSFILYSLIAVVFFEVYSSDSGPFFSALVICVCSAYFLKLWSFLYTTSENIYYEKKTENRITIKNFLYFLIAPTFCYQDSYPKSERIRISYCLGKILEIIACGGLILYILLQFIKPGCISMNFEFDNVNEILLVFSRNIFRFILWIGSSGLLLFYLFFHCWLNLLSEVIKFSDRNFYEDWWNSTDFRVFWKKWNKPVHNWASVYIYRVLRSKGVSRQCSIAAVFTFSAVAHEAIIAAILHRLTYPLIMAEMIVQIVILPLSFTLKRIVPNSLLKFYIMGLFCVFGPPGLFLMYVLLTGDPLLLQ